MLSCEKDLSSLELSKKAYPFPQLMPKKILLGRLRNAARTTPSPALKKFMNKKCFADTPTPVNGQKLGLI